MKCPSCGYLSLDETARCSRCGTLVREDDSRNAAAAGEGELFSLKIAAGDDSPPAAEQSSPVSAEKEPEKEQVFHLGDEAEAGWPALQQKTTGTGESAEGLHLDDLRVDFDPGGEGPAAPPGADLTLSETVEEEGGLEPDDLPEDVWASGRVDHWRRIGAFAIDHAVIAGVFSLFVIAAVVSLKAVGVEPGAVAAPDIVARLILPFYLLGLFLSLAYFTFVPGWTGVTFGKRALGLDVRLLDGGSPAYGHLFLRWVGYLLSVTPVFLGFFWIFYDRHGRGWHDYLAGTWVQNRESAQ